MTQKFPLYYWVLILLLQSTIIFHKMDLDEFYLWNIVALVGSLFFLFNRIFKKRVALNYEILLSIFIGINAVMTFLATVIHDNSYLVASVSLLVAITPFSFSYYVWKTESLNKINLGKGLKEKSFGSP